MTLTLFCFFLFACCCWCCGCCCCCFGLSPLFFALVLLVVVLFCVFFGLKSSSSMLRTANRDGTAVAIFSSDNERKRTSKVDSDVESALSMSGQRCLARKLANLRSQRQRQPRLVNCRCCDA